MAKEIKTDWTSFKSFISLKNLPVQFVDRGTFYDIFATDGPVLFETSIVKTDPPSQDQQDFEDNFQSSSNRKIEVSDVKEITDKVNSSLTYLGRSLDLDAEVNDPKWQIRRILVQGNLITTNFANNGKYDQVWDDRNNLFVPPVLDNGASLLFNGSDQYIDLGNNYTFGPATAFSWSLWMKANNLTAHRRFISKTTQDVLVYGYNFGHNDSGRLWAQLRAPGTLRAHTFSTVLNPGEWYHVCFTYDGSSNMSGLTAYINGVPEPSVPSASLSQWTVSDPLHIGARGGNFNFSGNMNQVSLFNKELSAAQVQELFNDGSPGDLNSYSQLANLLSWWELNDGATVPTELDVIGGVHGTLVNLDESSYQAMDVP